MKPSVPIKKGTSPNKSQWTHGPGAITHIVCHTPEGTYEGTIAYMGRSSAQASYHLLVKKDGTEATQLVPFGMKAWHALSWNAISEGLSLCEYTGKTTSAGEEALAELVAWRCVARGIPPKWNASTKGTGVCRHGDLQANRSDPMSLWKFRYRFMPRVKRWHRYHSGDDLTSKRGYWAWRAWWCSIGPWEGKGRKEAGREYRPNVPRVIPPNWWAKLARSGGCG